MTEARVSTVPSIVLIWIVLGLSEMKYLKVFKNTKPRL